jgi:predicted type IV restriction endonuclease
MRSSLIAVDGDQYEDGKRQLDELIAWWAAQDGPSRNEATTRLHLIDVLLVDVLRWPRAAVKCEESHEGAYADYSLGSPATRIILEAKREGTTFELPAGVGSGPMPLPAVIEGSPAVRDAVRQALGYCQERGVPIAVVSNGHQLIAFMAFRQDGHPPLAARALVFDSLAAMREKFKTLWDNLCMDGAEVLALQATVADEPLRPPPEKLAARIPDYPGYWVRNRISTELQTVGDLILADLPSAPELEEAFLKECYLASSTLSEYALVSREILEARYSAIESEEMEVSTDPARDSVGLSEGLQVEVTAASLGRRPLILLGDVGVGKSIFIRHFVRIDARDVMDRSIVLDINFGGEPALATDLRAYVMERFIEQLRERYDIDVEDNKFVRSVYPHEMRSFANGVNGALKNSNPALYAEKEVAFLERKLGNRDGHLQASFRHITRTQKRQVIIFLDNIDQRDLDFQERVFLIGQSLAETWPATVFLSLRPETFFASRTAGALTAYQPRVFTITPPSAGTVIRKRLTYCRNLVADPETRAKIMPDALAKQAELLARYLGIVDESFAHMQALTEFVENLAGGNVRSALEFLNTFVGSGHVDVQKIFDIVEETQHYYVPLHEFVRAIMYGDYRYYHPARSPIANVFEISTPDRREHFLLPIILAYVERSGEVGEHEGFVDVERIMAFSQDLGFLPAQIEFALRRAAQRRLLQRSPRTQDDGRRRYRITTVGAYTYKKLMGSFVYLDAVIVDTPIVDPEVAGKIDDCSDIRDRLSRAVLFADYLDACWSETKPSGETFDWNEARASLADEYERIERTIARGAQLEIESS